jgi:hypothetical protein
MRRIRQEAHKLKANTYLEVRYETLLAEPEEVLRDVAAHLELDVVRSWVEQCSKLVRPKANCGQLTPQTCRDLMVEDLIALNEIGGVPFFLYPADASFGDLQSALDQAGARPRLQRAGDAVQVAIGVLATHTAVENPRLRSRALGLLREIVAARGDDPSGWAVLASAES